MKLTYPTLLKALRDSGLKKDETVMVQSSLLHIGPVEGVDTRTGLSEFYYRALREVIGPNGTLLVHTPFEAYGRYGTPFHVESSPSTAGVLSQYVLDLPGAVRSTHPIVSVAGVGPRAEAICGGEHFAGFGWESPWGRMHRADIRFITLGLGLAKGLSFLHYVESMYGVPYQYTKLFQCPVFQNGKELRGPFTMNVRYLDFSIHYNYDRFEEYMLKNNLACECRFERGLLLQSTTAQAAFSGGFACLSQDRFAFLMTPPNFRQGELPIDGPTGEMQWVYHSPRTQGSI